MNEIEFLVAMIRDLENHIQGIKRRINKIHKEQKEKEDKK